MPDSPDVNRAVQRIDALLGEFDPQSRGKAEELVRVLMEVYGAGLGRILDLLDEAGESSQAVLESLVRDKLVASLMLIHGLHPVDAETRIQEALAPIERRLNGVQLVFEGVQGGIARIRISSNGSGAVPPGLAGAIEGAVAAAAPDLDGVNIEAPAKLVQIGLAPGA
jgi:hypothetical protein